MVVKTNAAVVFTHSLLDDLAENPNEVLLFMTVMFSCFIWLVLRLASFMSRVPSWLGGRDTNFKTNTISQISFTALKLSSSLQSIVLKKKEKDFLQNWKIFSAGFFNNPPGPVVEGGLSIPEELVLKPAAEGAVVPRIA